MDCPTARALRPVRALVWAAGILGLGLIVLVVQQVLAEPASADTPGPAVDSQALEPAAPVVEALEPAAPVVEAVAPVAEPLAPAVEAAAPIVDAAGPIAAPVIDTVTPVVAPVVDAAMPVVAPVVDAAAPALVATAPVVAPAVDAVAPMLAPLAEAATPTAGLVVDAVAPVVAPVVQALPPAVEVVDSVVTPVAGAVGPIVESVAGSGPGPPNPRPDPPGSSPGAVHRHDAASAHRPAPPADNRAPVPSPWGATGAGDLPIPALGSEGDTAAGRGAAAGGVPPGPLALAVPSAVPGGLGGSGSGGDGPSVLFAVLAGGLLGLGLARGGLVHDRAARLAGLAGGPGGLPG